MVLIARGLIVPTTGSFGNEKIHKTFGGAVILKGAGSLIAGDSGITGVVTQGNPGMATVLVWRDFVSALR